MRVRALGPPQGRHLLAAARGTISCPPRSLSRRPPQRASSSRFRPHLTGRADRPLPPPAPQEQRLPEPSALARRLRDFLREQRGPWTEAAPCALALLSRPTDGGTRPHVAGPGCLSSAGVPGAVRAPRGGRGDSRRSAVRRWVLLPRQPQPLRPGVIPSCRPARACGSITTS